MQTKLNVVILLAAVVIVILVLVRKYRRSMHLEKMAEFYYGTYRWKETEEKVYCRINIKDDPFHLSGYNSLLEKEEEKEKERVIKDIIKRFKKDPNLLKDAESSYNKQQYKYAIYQENKRKKLIAKRAFAYDYEDLLYHIFESTAEEYYGGWSIEGLRKEELIQKIAEIKNISSNEAEDVFKILVDHDLIWYMGNGKYELTNMLRSGNPDCYVISNTDINFDEWMFAQRLEENKKN